MFIAKISNSLFGHEVLISKKRVSNLKVICELTQNKLLFRYEPAFFLILDSSNDSRFKR